MTFKHVLSAFILVIFIGIGFGSDENTSSNNTSSKNSSTESNSTEIKKEKKCVGSKNCITSVRRNFVNTGKQILGEEYLGEGQFGISFMDISKGSSYNTFNSVVTTDCDCNIINVVVNPM